MPRNDSPHPQEVDQTHQGSAALWPRLTGGSIEKKKFRQQVSSVYFPRMGYGDEHVQQVYCEKAHRQVQEANTHVLTGGDLNAHVGSNEEAEAIKSKYIKRLAFGEQNSRGQ